MEGNVFDVFRVLSLVVTWAIPALLVLAVVAFIVLGPAIALAGVIHRWYETARDKLRRRAPAGTHLPEHIKQYTEAAPGK